MITCTLKRKRRAKTIGIASCPDNRHSSITHSSYFPAAPTLIFEKWTDKRKRGRIGKRIRNDGRTKQESLTKI
uniref:THAP-type domain-containing protein n=1 Tax=Heterorhabditis bacteriophora TaxID=37862 RepID=A0A1I7XQ56_HETBA